MSEAPPQEDTPVVGLGDSSATTTTPADSAAPTTSSPTATSARSIAFSPLLGGSKKRREQRRRQQRSSRRKASKKDVSSSASSSRRRNDNDEQAGGSSSLYLSDDNDENHTNHLRPGAVSILRRTPATQEVNNTDVEDAASQQNYPTTTSISAGDLGMDVENAVLQPPSSLQETTPEILVNAVLVANHSDVTATAEELLQGQQQHDDDHDSVMEARLERYMSQKIVDGRAVAVPDEESTHADSGKRKSKLLWLLAFGLIVAVAIVVGLAVGLSSNNQDSDDDPLTPAEQALVSLISAVSFDNGTELQSPGTPQYQAMQWLLEQQGDDPNAALDKVADPFSTSAKKMIQRYVLATFYYSTNGQQWINSTGWLGTGNECSDWYFDNVLFDRNYFEDSLVLDSYETCDGQGRVQHIDLDFNNLQGSLPPELGLLSDSLVTLWLDDNRLFGTLPTELGYLTNLGTLFLRNNLLSGSLPTEIGQWTALGLTSLPGTFVISKNRLTGTLPTEIGRLSNLLATFNLESNMLSGTIPTEIGMLSSVLDIRLFNNQLDGTIPSELGRLTQMNNALFLHSNDLTGTIPATLGMLTGLKSLDVSGNDLSGLVAPEICLLRNDTLSRLQVDCGGNVSCTCCTGC